MNQVGHVLKSLNQEPGIGDCLVNMLPEEHSGSSDAVASFLHFVLERQKIWSNKRKRREVLTTNHVLASKWFTNMYRYVNIECRGICIMASFKACHKKALMINSTKKLEGSDRDSIV